MSNIAGIIKTLQNIMRKDAGFPAMRSGLSSSAG